MFEDELATDKKTALKIMRDVLEFRVTGNAPNEEIVHLLYFKDDETFTALSLVSIIGLCSIFLTFLMTQYSYLYAFLVFLATASFTYYYALDLKRRHTVIMNKAHDAHFFDGVVQRAGRKKATFLYHKFKNKRK